MPLSQDDRVKYKALYLQTAKPYVQQLQDSVMSFQDGTIDQEKLEIAHRAAHSMTSQSRMMEYEKTAQLTSIMEKIFKAKVDALLELSPELLVSLQSATAKLQEDITSIETNDSEIDLGTEHDELAAIAKIPVE